MDPRLPDLTGWTRTGTDISTDGIKYERWVRGHASEAKYIDVSVDKTLWRQVPDPTVTQAPPTWHRIG